MTSYGDTELEYYGDNHHLGSNLISDSYPLVHSDREFGILFEAYMNL